MRFSLATVNNMNLTAGSASLPLMEWFFDHCLDRFAGLSHVFHKTITTLALKQLTDDQCMKRVAVGEEDPFSILFERYGELVFGYCVKLLKDRERAEDASQDVWMKVIKNAGKYQSQGKFRAWLLQIARTTCFSLFRDLKKTASEDVSEHEIEDVSQQGILDLMGAEQDRTKLKKCIENLPENQRTALVVWMTEDKSYEEIAEQMQTSVSAVKSLLFRSRQTLKDMLEKKNG